METLDERLERLYGPQKRKYPGTECINMPPQLSYYERLAYESGNTWHRQPRTGKEMAEMLLGHSIDKEWYYNQST